MRDVSSCSCAAPPNGPLVPPPCPATAGAAADGVPTCRRRHRHRHRHRRCLPPLLLLCASALLLLGSSGAAGGFVPAAGPPREGRRGGCPAIEARSAAGKVRAPSELSGLGRGPSSPDPATEAEAEEAAAAVDVDPTSPPSVLAHILAQSTRLDSMYDRSARMRCPFLRRRAHDTIDAAAMILRFLVIRHKSLGVFDPLLLGGAAIFGGGEAGGRDRLGEADGLLQSSVVPPGCKAVGRHVSMNPDGTVRKSRYLPVAEMARTLELDWTAGAGGIHRGYYLTGRLNSTVYRDDCLFDGPDPDMPVRGLRKYLSAASHLFDAATSRAELLSISWEGGGEGKAGHGVVVARWCLGGTLMLPWRPSVRPWTGTTRYHLDEEGLIFLHEEEWDITVSEAFVSTASPQLGEMIWGPKRRVEPRGGTTERSLASE